VASAATAGHSGTVNYAHVHTGGDDGEAASGSPPGEFARRLCCPLTRPAGRRARQQRDYATVTQPVRAVKQYRTGVVTGAKI